MKKNGVKKLKGIGGWLILQTILFFSMAILGILYVISGFFLFGINISIIAMGILSIISIYVLYLEFRHKKGFPIWAIIWNWFFLIVLEMIYLLEDLARSNFNYSDFAFNLPLSFILPLIWTFYFLKSERVKNTFVK